MSKAYSGLILSALFLGISIFGINTAYAQVSEPVILTVDLSVGSTDASTGGQVSILQNFLQQLGHFNDGITGYFGTVTQAAVASFQQANNLPSTGYVGPLTRALIAVLTTNPGTEDEEDIYNNGSVTINSISGPDTLRVNKRGSWRVRATDSNDERIRYAVNWGEADECLDYVGNPCHDEDSVSDFQRSSRFTHKYSRAGIYNATFFARNESGDMAEKVKVVTVTDRTSPGPVSPSSMTMVNVSSRAQTLSGDGVAISGFTISGNGVGGKKVIIRGIGPSLSNFGLQNVLADPTISLRDSSGREIASNNNWQDTNSTVIQATGLAPTRASESAIVTFLDRGSYTVVLSGNNISNNNNIGVVEVYDLGDPADDIANEISNVSTRGRSNGGDNVIISGMTIRSNGDTPQKFLFRGMGPSLASYGLTGVMSDPTITLYNSAGVAVASNNDWKNGNDESQIRATGFAPSDDRESAIIQTLSPGVYTVILRGVNNTTGLGLVEIYKINGTGTSTGDPSITSLDPSSGSVGTQVTVEGRGFSETGNTVNFGSGVIPNISRNPTTQVGTRTSLVFTVPNSLTPACAYATSGPICMIQSRETTPGTYQVSVTNDKGDTSNHVNFRVTAGSQANVPTVTSVSPTSGAIGTSVTVRGTGFNNSMNVLLIDGSEAGSAVSSGGQTLTFTIPSTVSHPSCNSFTENPCLQSIISITPGNHSLSIRNINGTSNDTVSFVVTAPVSHVHPPVGYFDSVNSSGVAAGWTYDPDQSGTSIPVHFYIERNGTWAYAGESVANTSRPDVNQAYGISGNHGFTWSIPSSYRDGMNHQMSVYAIDIGGNGSTNTALTNSPRTFRIP